MTTTYLLALVLTLAVELPLVAWLAGPTARPRILLDALLLNLFTHPLAVLAVNHLTPPEQPWGLAFVGIELGVVTVEALGYRFGTELSWRQALGLSALANTITAALSPLLGGIL